MNANECAKIACSHLIRYVLAQFHLNKSKLLAFTFKYISVHSEPQKMRQCAGQRFNHSGSTTACLRTLSFFTNIYQLPPTMCCLQMIVDEQYQKKKIKTACWLKLSQLVSTMMPKPSHWQISVQYKKTKKNAMNPVR